jgi:hypothetical protein
MGRLLQPTWLWICLALASSPGAARAADVEELAVLANDVNQEHCAGIYTQDVSLAAQGYQKVAGAWETVDLGYEETRSPVLLYWRAVLAQCLGQDEIAERDLQEFAQQQDGTDDSDLAGMLGDAQRRLKRLAVKPDPAPPAFGGLDPPRTVLLVGAAVTAGTGFAICLGAYRTGSLQTEEAPYIAARRANIAGLVVGLTGVGIGLTCLLTLAVPHESDATVALLPGPISFVEIRF